MSIILYKYKGFYIRVLFISNMVNRLLKKQIDNIFPKKQAEALVLRLNNKLKSDPNSNEYYAFRKVREKLLLMDKLLKFEEIQDILNDKRYKNSKRLDEDRLNFKLSNMDIPGLGKLTKEKLESNDIITTNDLLRKTPEEIEDLGGMSQSVAKKVQENVLKLVIIKKK